MNPKAKKFLSNFFFGFISNEHAIEGAKSHPWWVGLIIAVFAVTLPVVPITVSQARSYGSSFLSKNVYRFDQNIANVTVDLAKDNKEFKVEEAYLNYYIGETAQVVDIVKDKTPVAQHISASTNQYELVVYYTQREKNDLKTFVNEINSLTYKVGTVEAPEDGYEGSLYSPSFIVLSSGSIYTKINKDDSTEAGSNTYTNFSTDWKHMEGFKLVANALPEGKTATTVDLNSEDDVAAIFKNWKTYYNKAFITQKNYNTWMTSLLFLGIYVALEFVMGLLVFLLTRGKNNMFNYLKFIDTHKIVWWASLCPAILAMIAGFIFSNFAQMIFIILLGLRIMWISMRQLRPQQ